MLPRVGVRSTKNLQHAAEKSGFFFEKRFAFFASVGRSARVHQKFYVEIALFQKYNVTRQFACIHLREL